MKTFLLCRKNGEKPNPIFLSSYLTERPRCKQRHLAFFFFFHCFVKSPLHATQLQHKGTKKKKSIDWI